MPEKKGSSLGELPFYKNQVKLTRYKYDPPMHCIFP